jgi:UDP-N-acetylmuramate--alanine ligase
MSGLAVLLKDMGLEVSGCDMARTSYIDKVVQQGIPFESGHDAEHLSLYEPDLLVYTSAISPEHPEILEARKKGLIVARRAEVLSQIFNARRGIGVAGTHGKTTTSSMIALVTDQFGLTPTVALGGELCDIGCNAKLGSGDLMVAELDESDGSFELFDCEVALVTNIDWDHVDHYPTHDSVVAAFGRFLDRVKPGGVGILCGEDSGVRQLAPLRAGLEEHQFYGYGTGWDWGATDIAYTYGGGVSFTVHRKGAPIGRIALRVSGDHNVLNALGACAASMRAGVPFEAVAQALRSFRGAKRRLQYVGSHAGYDIYDDYGHHPREIQATLSSLRSIFPGRRIVVIFQPHRFTRTQAMHHDFAEVLATADEAILVPVYAADESPIPGVSSSLIENSFPESRKNRIHRVESFGEAVSSAMDVAREGDLFLTIGAGNISVLGKRLLESMLARKPSQVPGDELAVVA